ncbi:MAG TPA: HEAT repeat domain-containing protein, partial [Pyrinomonadaceae bacterium]|nr:HEAT repeat domain-containing protein [Pyrinomonadaceae bacterium]
TAALKETPAPKTTTVEKTATAPAPVPPVAKKDKDKEKDKQKDFKTSPALSAPISAPVAEKTTETAKSQASIADKIADREDADSTLVTAAQEPAATTTAVEPPAVTVVAPLPASEAPAEPKKSLLDEQVTSEITPVVPVDAERVEVEIKRLLDGQVYDKTALAGADMMTRQMIAAELLAALAGRNAERKQRARTAFVEQGFFNETANDLHFAGAPAERASAARSLGLLGDRVATSHLIAALADQTMEVRRACVEALAEVRDPKAVPALKSLLEREKDLKVKVPRKLIQRAIEACERGSEETLTPTATAIAPAPSEPIATEPAATVETAIEPTAIETVAAETTATETIETETTAIEPFAAEVATPEVATLEVTPVEVSPAETTVSADDETPTLVADETPTLVSEPVVSEEPLRVVEIEPVAAFEPTSDANVETPTVLTQAPLDIERAEVVPESVPVEEEVIDLRLEPEAPTVVADEPEREVEDATLPPRAAEPSTPFFAGETLAVPTEELNASAEELSTPTIAPPATEFETHRQETFETHREEAVETVSHVAPLEGFETTQVPDTSPRGEFDWIELDDLHAPPTPAPTTTSDEPQEIDLTEEVSRAGFEPQPIAAEASAPREEFNAPQSSPALKWDEPTAEAVAPTVETAETSEAATLEEDFSTVPKGIQQRLASEEPAERAIAVKELARLGGGDDAFREICAAFDDPSQDVRSAAARTLYEMQDDRAESFTRALREAPPERRRHIGGAIASSGLAVEAIGQLTGASRDKTYEAFSLLFLMAKAGEVQPLVRAIEAHPDNEVRLAVVKLLALSGQREILPAFRRLAVRGSLPTEVRSAVMEAIYQISSSTNNAPHDTSTPV